METELSEGVSPAGNPRASISGPEGFAEAFDELFLRAYQQAFKLLGDRQEAEDIAQEACARACVRWQQLDEPQAWVVHVVTNLAFDRFRRLKSAARYARLPQASVARSEGPVTDAHLDLHRALAKLPKRQREAIALRYLADLSEEQTAAVLGCALGTVKSHTARGLRALRATSDLADEVEMP